MKDMITNKEIVGEPKSIKLYRGEVVSVDTTRAGNYTRMTTTYKNLREFLLTIDAKTYSKAKVASVFSLNGFSGWGMLVLSVIVAGILINIFTSSKIYATFFICFPWVIPVAMLFYMLISGNGKTPEEVLARRYAKKIALDKKQVVLTEERYQKTKPVNK